ncbi:prophage tail fiber family protein [Escherichia coli 2860050]|nr:prophage tail fiber family protein [Escherichia coli 2860050]
MYEDSRPGTLNDFLGAMTEDDARPRHCAVLTDGGRGGA